MEEIERTMKSEKIYDGKILSLKIDTVELPNRKYSKREIVEHNPVSAIVAVTNEDEILMVKQYRKAVDKYIYEIPAGILELNESPQEGALRELEEETGFVTEDIEYILEFFSSPGFCTEKVYVFVAENLIKKEQKLDEDEFLECEKIPFDDILKMIEVGEIVDAKSIAGILAYNQMRRKNEN